MKNTNNCTDNITVSDYGVICDDAVENNDIVLDNVKNISISFQTDDIQAGSGFVMLVEGTRRKYTEYYSENLYDAELKK